MYNLSTQKKICPICFKTPNKKNPFVTYHITYPPKAMVILACKYCNYTEYLLRTKKEIYGKETIRRKYWVIQYMKKYGIQL